MLSFPFMPSFRSHWHRALFFSLKFAQPFTITAGSVLMPAVLSSCSRYWRTSLSWSLFFTPSEPLSDSRQKIRKRYLFLPWSTLPLVVIVLTVLTASLTHWKSSFDRTSTSGWRTFFTMRVRIRRAFLEAMSYTTEAVLFVCLLK